MAGHPDFLSRGGMPLPPFFNPIKGLDTHSEEWLARTIANVIPQFTPATPSLPHRTFNHRTQSYRLGTTSVGDYIFAGNIGTNRSISERLDKLTLRLVNLGLLRSFRPSQAPPLQAGGS